MYLESRRISTIELLVVNYSSKKVPSLMLDWVLNKSLPPCEIKIDHQITATQKITLEVIHNSKKSQL